MSKSSEDYKEIGNEFFKRGEFNQSIKEYTAAIELDKENPVYYSNRSMAYLKVKDFQNSLNDSMYALDNLNLNDDAKLKSKLEFRRNQALNKLKNGITIVDPNIPIIDLSIMEVDEIPRDFFTAPKPKDNNKAELLPPKEIPVNMVTNKNISNIELPELPTIPFLSTLQTKSPLQVYYIYVLGIPIKIYSDIFKLSGIDDKFLKFYLEASIWDLNKDTPEYSNDIYETIECFTMLPRFSLTSMFISNSLVNQLGLLLKSKLNKDLKSIWC